MKKLAWLTDIHANHLSKKELEHFLASVWLKHPDAVLVGGDTSDGNFEFLERIAKLLKLPVYYVLGNHDFYGMDLGGVYKIAETTTEPSNLHYLPAVGPVNLEQGAKLIGIGGWGDAKCGLLEEAEGIADMEYIDEFRGMSKNSPSYKALLNELGEEQANGLEAQLLSLKKAPHTLVILTHVCPFPWAAYYDGKLSSPIWQPHFVWGAGGRVIAEYAKKNPTRRIVCLTGHSHSKGEVTKQGNIVVIAGNGSDYGKPQFKILSHDADYVGDYHKALV